MSQTNKLYLVIDANVIGHTCHGPLDPKTWKAAQILCKILYDNHIVVLDIKVSNEDSILDEYSRQSKSELAKWWLIALRTESNRISWRYKANISIPALSDPDDQKYFQVAVNSPHKIIVSEDGDLGTIANHNDVISKGIAIWGFDTAVAKL